MPQIKSVIFDHDGTLADTERFHYQIWQRLLAEYGIDFPEMDYIRLCNGIPSLENARLFTQRYPLKTTPEALSLEKERRTQEQFAQTPIPLMHGAEDCINSCLRSGLTIAVATGANFATVERSLGTRAFYPKLHNIACADQVPSGKPAPDVYRLAMQRMKLEPSQCVAVEDSPTGIASAKAAGLICLAIPNAYSRAQDLSQADFLLEGISQVLETLNKL